MGTSLFKDKALLQWLKLVLAEDIGSGDVTCKALPDKATGTAEIIAREAGVICGLPLLHTVFRQIDKRIRITILANEGDWIKKDQRVALIKGSVKSILTGERTVLNLLSAMSGIATKTKTFSDAVKNTTARIFDTRKTPPGLRALAKYAVRMGGGYNHRQGLYDMVLIKDNHIAAMGLTNAVECAKKRFPGLCVEVETESLLQFKEALKTQADIIMLDNMTPRQMREAVLLAKGKKKRPQLEASGGVTLANIRQIAKTGVDRIAIGGITHSFKILDLAMEMVQERTNR